MLLTLKALHPCITSVCEVNHGWLWVGQWPHISTQTFRPECKLSNTFLLSADSALRDKFPMSHPPLQS